MAAERNRREPTHPWRALARDLPDESGVALQLRSGGLRPEPHGGGDRTERRPGRALFPSDADVADSRRAGAALGGDAVQQLVRGRGAARDRDPGAERGPLRRVRCASGGARRAARHTVRDAASEARLARRGGGDLYARDVANPARGSLAAQRSLQPAAASPAASLVRAADALVDGGLRDGGAMLTSDARTACGGPLRGLTRWSLVGVRVAHCRRRGAL